jgi:hypothetical protein
MSVYRIHCSAAEGVSMFPQAKLVILPAFLLPIACLLVTAVPGSADPKEREPVGTTLYHRDRDHLWNRVHAALLVRTGPDGRAYGEDRLEPLLWKESEYLLKGKSADRAVAVLEEFLREKGESLIEDPVKRAVLQRDLWLVSNWSAGGRLSAPLAKVIDRLALSPDQIAKLPDNYAAAVASKKYADRFDPEKPERSYLPPDLFKPDGPWVCVGRTDGPTAPQHLEESGFNRFTNSVFLVFVKLPGGRDATLDYLKRLAAFDKPWALPNADEKSRERYQFLPNPAVPQFPKGTEVALVRRALLIDSSRRVVPSPLTESIQLRVMRADTPTMTPALLDQLSPFSPAGLRRVAERQAFFDFQLRRADLFAKEAGGLRDVSGERDFKTGFASHQWDEFGQQRSPASTGGPFPQRSQPFENNRASCAICHPLPGVYGFNSLQDFRARIARDGDKLKPYPLAAMKVDDVEKAAIKWKGKLEK